MPGARDILITSFEPSGDALGAPLVAELRRRDPNLRFFALGGPRLKAAGVEMLETTIHDAVIGVPPLKKILEHKARLTRLRAWMPAQKLAAVIPTDSPAANWSVCKLTRELQPQAKVLHLAAPQLWAWASWRINKMRRLSDHVMCLLPFEPDWFGAQGMPGTFVGHPIFDEPTTERAARQRTSADAWHDAEHRLALLPGSRPSEWRNNWGTMCGCFERIATARPGVRAAVAAVDDQAARTIAQICMPNSASATAASELALDFHSGQTDAVLDWANTVLAVSGTVTLQVAAHRRPMVAMYNGNRVMWHGLGRWLISTRTFTLPNLIGEWLGMGKRVPEFVPHFGAVEPIVRAVEPLLGDGPARRSQIELFDAIHAQYAGVRFQQRAADVVQRFIGD